MSSAIDSALSGLAASSKSLEISANNLANQFSTQSQGSNGQVTNQPYTPQKLDQISLTNGGVLALATNVNPATVSVANPQGGVMQQPNVDPANELIQQNIASYDFKANVKTIQTQDSMFKSLLDIFS